MKFPSFTKTRFLVNINIRVFRHNKIERYKVIAMVEQVRAIREL